MADISAKEVQALREKTGVGMMDCKRALVEANGDMDKAVTLLREKGLAAAAKKAGRIAAEGVVSIYNKNNTAVLVEVNAETDFVSKNDKFVDYANNVTELIATKNPKDVAELLTMKYPSSDLTVDQMLKELILVIGENMSIRRFVRVEGNVYTYNHGNGKIGVVVNIEADTEIAKTPDFAAFGKDLCMQIAAMNPIYLSKESVPATEIENEKNILIAQIKNDPKTANKPEAVIEKMVAGRINKFYEQNCLLEQAYFKEENMSVKQYIDESSKKFNGVKLLSYDRFEKGEGIAKKEDNFADEVASMTK